MGIDVDTEPNPYEIARSIRINQSVGQGAEEVRAGLATVRVRRVLTEQGLISTSDLEHNLTVGFAKMPQSIRKEIAARFKK